MHSTATSDASAVAASSAEVGSYLARAEISRLRGALMEAESRHRQSVQRTDGFLNILANELRTPLAPMTHALQILRQRGPHAPEVHWAREVIAHQMQQMERLIEDLVDLSLLENGGIVLQRQRVSLMEVVDRAVASMRAYLERYTHHLTVTLPPAQVLLDADPRRLTHLIGHLLSNAAKFTHPGGNIWVSADVEGDEVVLSVRDSGVGFSAERMATLFQPFRQLDRARRPEGGLGIGLSLVRHLAELHGGSIAARSDGPGLGSTFLLRLPIVKPEPVGPETKTDDRPSRVLVVDDNHLAADSLTILLQEAGYESGTAYDGAEALKRAEAFRPDVILLDLGLPQQSGIDICERLRQESWGKEILIVAVTGWGQAAMRSQTLEAGFDDHLVKPVHPERLMQLIQGHQRGLRV